jgi:hypothetical protein
MSAITNVGFGSKFEVIEYEDRRARNVGVFELNMLLGILDKYEGVELLVGGIVAALNVLKLGEGCRVHYEAASEVVRVRKLLGDNRELGSEKVRCYDGRVRTFHAVLFWFADVHSKVFDKCETLIREMVAESLASNPIEMVDAEEDLLEDVG